MKKSLLLIISSLFLLASCGGEKYDFYSYRDDLSDESLNHYVGETVDGTYHLHNWYPSDIDLAVDVDEDITTGVCNVTYAKSTGKDYRFIYTPVCGRFADFTYINIVAKGIPGKGITFRMLYGENDEEGTNVLGNDVSFSLSEEYEIHSLKVKGTLHTRMDLLRKVCIYPEIGLSGPTIRGSFSFTDVYFSKTLPEGATLENPGVDTGDTSVNVNGWKTEGWTFYSLYNAGENKTGVSYAKAAEWAFIEKDIDIKDDLNAVRFTFENILAGEVPSVTCIRFIIRGDVSRHVWEDVPYEYDEYYEYPIYDYDLTKEDEVQPNKDGLTVLEISLDSAIAYIADHHENGYRLVLMIESHPDDYYKYEFSRGGNMLISDFELYHQEPKIEYYSLTDNPSVGSITLSDKKGVEKNIAYEGISGSAYWPRVNRMVLDATHDSVFKLTVKNNGENTAKIQVHAGVPNDDRSDAKNNSFFPLWNNRGLQDDYFDDGETIELAANEEKTVTISIDEPTEENKITENDVITLIQLLVDNCWGDSNLRTGNIDIVSFVIE